jgi:endonuclease-3
LQKLQGATPFNVAYATQAALGGHSIPLDKGALGVLYVLGVVSQSDADASNVPGLERTIPKSKGQEFGALLHELGADFIANPFSPTLRELLLSIAADAKDRFPKRAVKKPPAPQPVPSKATAESKKKTKEAPTAKKAERSAAKRATSAPKAAAHPKKKPSGGAKKTAAKSLAKRKPR